MTQSNQRALPPEGRFTYVEAREEGHDDAK
jgi:hypothetical protein